ncbi:hypothetical protein H6P81_020123 [Aristolochia fimbriata]|uniref:DUF7026 domain-containing protein n=1 Tax=Aristolochia fimbriata TaxID=158543 RepID=A0AAV7DTP2_ARIFI|nr:hypothetical protein H6P81_020123 [Aristolochia fimbriata]
MATRVPLFSPQILSETLESQKLPLAQSRSRRRRRSHLCCNFSDAELAADLSSQVSRIDTHSTLKKEAMKKSTDMLFGDFCGYLGLKAEAVKRNWRQMEEGEKLDTLRGFLDGWGANFHPLSVKSVKEMVEEHVGGEDPSRLSAPSIRFPSLKKLMRFSEAEKK